MTATAEPPAEGAPAPPAPEPPVLEARKVSVPRRIPLGVLLGLFLGAIFLGIPLFVLPFLNDHGVQTGANPTVLAVLGAVIAFFEAARYVAKPTRAYGPLWICAAGAFAGWLVYLYFVSRITLTFISNISITVGFNLLLLLMAVVPALALAAAIVTTIEDVRHPGERMPFDFPLRRWGRRRHTSA